jgi:hypothetical protein
MIRQFDVTKREANRALEGTEGAELEALADKLHGLSDGVDNEELATSKGVRMAADGDDEDDDGWVDEVELLSREERVAHEASVLPVKLALVKVRQCLVTRVTQRDSLTPP